MSGPLAVYTQVGAGANNKGINIKIGQSYDTGNDKTMGMNVLEIKGGLGESLGWSGGGQRDDSFKKYSNITLKRGVLAEDNKYFDWLNVIYF